jgi:hypothetical protein
MTTLFYDILVSYVWVIISWVFELAFLVFDVCSQNHRVYLSSNQNQLESDSKLIALDHWSQNQSRKIFMWEILLTTNYLSISFYFLYSSMTFIETWKEKDHNYTRDRRNRSYCMALNSGMRMFRGWSIFLFDESGFARKQAKLIWTKSKLKLMISLDVDSRLQYDNEKLRKTFVIVFICPHVTIIF